MQRAVVSGLLALLAVVLQVTVVDRLPLPGGSVPDVALVAVVAVGLTRGPSAGALTGFLAGLGLDLAPPASHPIGESALIFCVVGYGCGRLNGWLDGSPVRLLAAAVVGTGAGETLQAILGMALGDPDVTPSAVRHILPGAVLYDALLCAVAVSLAALTRRRRGNRRPAVPPIRVADLARTGMITGAERTARPVGGRAARLARTRQGRAGRAPATVLIGHIARPTALRADARRPEGRYRPARSRPAGIRRSASDLRAPRPGRSVRRSGPRPDRGDSAIRPGRRPGVRRTLVRLRLGAPRPGAEHGLRLRGGPRFGGNGLPPRAGGGVPRGNIVPRKGLFPRRGSFGRRAGIGRRAPRVPGTSGGRRGGSRAQRFSTVARPSRWRLAAAFAACVGLLIALAGRLWYVQVAKGSDYASLARQEQVRTIVVPPVRGQILDDTGRALVANRPSLVVTVNKTVLASQADGGRAELRRLAALLGVRDRLLRDRLRLCTAGVSQPCWAGSPYQPVPVRQDVPERVGVQVMEDRRQLPGVTARVKPVVRYPEGTSAAQMLGYLQPITPQEERLRHLPLAGPADAELVGQSGLEAQYDAALRGVPGTRHVVVNAAGDVTGTVPWTRRSRPVPGSDLVTSINAHVQADAERALAHAIRKARAEGNLGATTGAAVVMTTAGRVVAMASYPSYDPGIWTRGISERQFKRLFGAADGEPILNRAIQGEYAPGSTWKVTSTAAAVAAGYSLAGPYDCPGSVSVGGRTFYNDNPFNSGAMSLHAALVVSCDTVFYQLAYDIWLRDDRKANVVTSARAPVQAMQKMELAWGFGRATGIDLPGESAGTVPTRPWLYRFYRKNKKAWCRDGRQYGSYVQRIAYQDCHYGNVWEPGLAVDAAIGQGYVTVTPLQLARAYAALANGGTLYSPRLGEALIRPDGRVVRRITPPVVGHLPVSAGVLAYIRHALADVMTQGTAAPAFAGFPLRRVCVAGKTGTAQVVGRLATSVFASYAPCVHPKYVVVMMIPASGYGADVSAPAVRQIWDGIYGLEGHRAALPGGQLPSGIPRPAGSRSASSAVGNAGSTR